MMFKMCSRAVMRRSCAVVATTLGCASLALAAPAAASAFSWPEYQDAGSLISNAQAPTGDGPLTAITGHVGGLQDMYKVCLTGDDLSAATTTGSNPMLWLFDASGRLVTYDDDSGADAEAVVGLTAPAAGTYYLAIVSAGNFAQDASQEVMTQPGSGPLAGWSHDANYAFDYSIALSGVQACPESTAPTVTITTPPEGATYLLGESVIADYACSDEAGGSGLADCVGTVADGAPVDTASVGAKQFAVTARDNAGNETAVVHHYNVVYAFDGFEAPIDSTSLNVIKAGQAVPVKFSLGGDMGLAILAEGSPSWRPVQCGLLPLDDVGQTPAAGASGLSYDASSGTYTYTWKTPKAWPAGTCRELTVTLIDGTGHSALFMSR